MLIAHKARKSSNLIFARTCPLKNQPTWWVYGKANMSSSRTTLAGLGIAVALVSLALTGCSFSVGTSGHGGDCATVANAANAAKDSVNNTKVADSAAYATAIAKISSDYTDAISSVKDEQLLPIGQKFGTILDTLSSGVEADPTGTVATASTDLDQSLKDITAACQ